MGLLLLTVMTVSRVHQHYSFLAVVRPALLLVAVTFLSAVLDPSKLSQKALFFTWPSKTIAAFAVMACISVPFGISAGAAGSFVLKLYLPVLVFAGLLIVATRTTSDLFALVWAFVIGGGILAYFADFVFQLQTAYGQARLSDMYMYDANDAGLVMIVAIPLTVLTLQTSRTTGKVVSLLFLFLELYAVARTGSRGAFVGMLALGLGLVVLANGVSFIGRLSVLLVSAGILVLTAPQGYWEKMLSLADPKSDYNWTAKDGRKQIAKRGLKYMMDYPVAGIGIGNFSRAEGTISEKAQNWTPGQAGIRWAAPHNSHIEVGAEMGIPGLALWCVMLIGGIIAPIRLRRRLPKAWRRGTPEQRFLYSAPAYVSVSMFGFLVTSTFVSFAYLDPVYILLAFISGLYVCADGIMQSQGSAPAGLRRSGERRPPMGALSPAAVPRQL